MVAFTVVIALSFLSTAIWRLQVLSDDTRNLTERPLAKKRLMSGWVVNATTATRRTAAIARTADPELANYFGLETRESTARTTELQQKVGELLDTPEEKALLAQVGEARQQYVDGLPGMIF